MCYHYEIKAPVTAVVERLGVVPDARLAGWEGTVANGFSFPDMPVALNSRPHVLQLASWGLVPSWSQDLEIRKHTLNARWETLHEKPSFRGVVQQRCLVPATAFFEWKWLNAKGTKKEKFQIGMGGVEIFTLAGLWDQWINTATGQSLTSFTIVTRPAQGVMCDIHNSKLREPLALFPEEESAWLNGAAIESSRPPRWNARSLEPPPLTLFD